MLKNLKIENVAVIEKAEAEFSPGLNVLTGETGAGKSILIDSINAILGNRTSRDLVRTGAGKACIWATFTDLPEAVRSQLEQAGYEAGDELLLYREISAEGKSNCRVNGMPSTAAMLRDLSAGLINIHGQHDSQQLFDEENHLTYLDAFARDEKELEDYRAAFDALQSVRREMQKLSMDESEKLRLVETLKFQIDEIERAELQSGEEDELLERRKVLQNAEKLTDAMEAAVSALYGDESSDGAAAMIANAAHALERVSRVSDEMRQLSGKLNDLMYTAQDIADELRDKKDDLTYSADELEQIEERLDTLHKLKRKYGASVEDVLAYLQKSEQRLDEIEFASDRIESLKNRQAELQKEAVRLGEVLREKRLRAAKEMGTPIPCPPQADMRRC